MAAFAPFTDVRSVQTLIDGDKLALVHGAQDLSPHNSGAHTGDVSGVMLAKLGCTYVLVGHSERRELPGETDELLRQGGGCLPQRYGADPLRRRGSRSPGSRRPGLPTACCVDLRPPGAGRGLVLAYEPIWVIGSGRAATPADAQEVCGAFRAALAEIYSPEIADRVRVLYGGSVKSGNIAEIVAQPDVDGALVGGASLNGTEFALLAANSVGIVS